MNIFSFVDNIETLQAIVLIIGLALLILEVFIPDFGITGIIGIVVVIIGIFLTAETLFEALVMFLILLIILAFLATILFKSASKGSLSRKIILRDQLTKEAGFRSTEDMTVFLGRKGEAITMLRPSGIGEFDGVRLDVVTDGTYLNKGTSIKIVAVVGRRIVVEKIKEEEL